MIHPLKLAMEYYNSWYLLRTFFSYECCSSHGKNLLKDNALATYPSTKVNFPALVTIVSLCIPHVPISGCHKVTYSSTSSILYLGMAEKIPQRYISYNPPNHIAVPKNSWKVIDQHIVCMVFISVTLNEGLPARCDLISYIVAVVGNNVQLQPAIEE